MDVRLLTTDTDKADGLACELLIVVLPADEALWTLPKGLLTLVKDAISAGDLALKAGRTLYVHRPSGVKAGRVVLTVSGNHSAKAWFAAVQGGVAASRSSGASTWTLMAGGTYDVVPASEQVELAVRATSESLYVYRHTKPTADAPGAFSRLQIAVTKADVAAARAGLKRGFAVAAGVELARDTANRPANHCTPSYLADVARQLAKSHAVSVEVLDRKAVEKLKMGAFLSVARGSDEPLQFIVLRYDGATKKDAPLVLVGKGITFDSGGISIKPAAGMDEMKFDMGGAASVLGTFRAVAELQPKINLIGLIPTCENMVNGSATKPGDVVTSMSGLTIEVLNTDAEGRLILCDALTYAERFKPAAVVDIATLTGACVVALGHQHSGLFTPDDGLAQSLSAAGQRGLDSAWRMPVDDDYAVSLKSPFADMGNVGAREGGAITAALFLKRFTQNYRWAHLDIAGTAWKSGGAKGATGRPVPLLTQFVLDFVATPVAESVPSSSKSGVSKTRAAKPPAKTGSTARRRVAT